MGNLPLRGLQVPGRAQPPIGSTAVDAGLRRAGTGEGVMVKSARRFQGRWSRKRQALCVGDRDGRDVTAELRAAEQNAMLTFATTTDCLVLENGEVALAGTAAELSRNARVRSIYLGM